MDGGIRDCRRQGVFEKRLSRLVAREEDRGYEFIKNLVHVTQARSGRRLTSWEGRKNHASNPLVKSLHRCVWCWGPRQNVASGGEEALTLIASLDSIQRVYKHVDCECRYSAGLG
jgi:hypothetical protein